MNINVLAASIARDLFTEVGPYPDGVECPVASSLLLEHRKEAGLGTYIGGSWSEADVVARIEAAIEKAIAAKEQPK